jgi:peptidoglycan/LPS O-acetylase OafA/YrhL
VAPDVRNWPARYDLLDGLRGVACIGVLLHHLGVVPIGHYSVMIFFVISGYCITASARSSLRRGTSFTQYMARRMRRIYPPYLIAISFFACTRWLKSALTHGPAWHPTLLEWLQNLTLTQWMSIPLHPMAWPAANPTLFVAAFWSLNYEEQFYLVTGLIMLLSLRYGVGLIRGVLMLAAMGLLWNAVFPGGRVFGIFIEYWAHFSLGACLFFVLCECPRRSVRLGFLAVIAALGCCCALQISPRLGQPDLETAARVYFELGLLSLVTILLLLVRPLSARISRAVLWRPIAAIGTISYSLYLVHQFNLTLVGTIADHVLPATVPPALRITTEVALHIGIATCFWYLCERPFLNRPRPAETPSPTAPLSAAIGGER